MATILLANAIAAANPFWGAVISMAAGFVDQRLFGPKAPNATGSRMSDLSIQCSTYGVAINKVYGTTRIAGNVIWGTNFVEHKKEESPGGKGGGGGKTTTYSYTISFAIGLCEGEITGFNRVWADGKEVTDKFAGDNPAIEYTLYHGTETQEPDPFIEGIETSFPVPAYRGLAYIVIQHMDVTDFGNRIPNFTFEIVRKLNYLDSIVKEVSAGAGLHTQLGTADMEASDLAGIPIDGFCVSSEKTYRERIEQLMMVYTFGAAEANGKLLFIRKENYNRFPVPADFLGAKEGNCGEESSYTIERKHDRELPKLVNVSYLSLDKDYQAGLQTAVRPNSTSENTEKIDLDFVITDARAKELAEQKLYEAWVRRSTVAASLGPWWAFLAPGDILDMDLSGRRRWVQLTKTTLGVPGVIKVEGGTDVGGNTFRRTERMVDAEIPSSVPIPPSAITVEFLDIPRLPTDTRSDPVVYLAATGSPFYGANVFETRDGGASWILKTQMDSPSTMGMITTLLTAGSTEVWDEGNSVTVVLTHGTLESRPEVDVLNGYNAAVIGNEIVQFRSATLIAVNTYILSGLLRGRLGTEEQVDKHSMGERFVLLKSATITTLPAPMSEWYSTKTYRIGPATKPVTDATYIEKMFSNNARLYQPWSVCNVAGSRDAANNITITWVRRDRSGGAWLDNADIPMSESIERYEVDIVSGSTVKRTLTVITPLVTYTAADQTNDFGTPQALLKVRIYQMSSIRGRGIGKEVIV
ncbi:hypothetical protein SOV_35580 [Sporomusa ovata DSM 2662]|uniref:phage tail protein n=3 Tax=Sporomusa ovata TaxID=2378 RepID=UPI0003884C3A|nr:phage tail protein [Sporomusa ovata]EQB24708.1 putative phage tail protein [Sporomusa ovata DSM 2662]